MARKDFRRVRDTFAKDSGLPFGRILTREYVLSVLESEGHQYRQRVFCPLTTLWAMLSQALSQDKSLNEAVRRILAYRVANGLPACSASSAGYSKARDRFPLAVMARLAQEIGQQVHDSADDAWRWRNRDVYLVDGTGLSMPDTDENRRVYSRAGNTKPGIGYPTLRAVARVSLSTGAVVDFAFNDANGKGTGEGRLLRGMIGNMKSGDIIIADRLFPSYRTLHALQERGVDMISISHQSRRVDFSEGVQLGENDHIVEWRKPLYQSALFTREEYDVLPETILVREFVIMIDSRTGKGKEPAIVISTITDPSIPQKELSDLYWRRWHCELDLRSIKQSMHLDVIRAKTPDMVAKEIYSHLLAWNLLRGVMVQSAKQSGVMPRQLSVKATMQTIESFTPAMMSTEASDVLYNAMLTTVAAHKVGNRPGRLEPRVKRRRPVWSLLMKKPRNHYNRRLAGQAPLS